MKCVIPDTYDIIDQKVHLCVYIYVFIDRYSKHHVTICYDAHYLMMFILFVLFRCCNLIVFAWPNIELEK